MKWKTGQETVEGLLSDGRLDEVPPSAETVDSLLSMAERHVVSATAASEDDPEGAFALAYDAARKAAAAVLAHQGLRATSRGGHVAVVDAIEAQFSGLPGFKSLDRLRRRRNQAEYPDAGYDPVTTSEAEDAVVVATDSIETARKLVDQVGLGVFR